MRTVSHLREDVLKRAAPQLAVLRVHPRGPRVRGERGLRQLLRDLQPQERVVGAVRRDRLQRRGEERTRAHHRGHLHTRGRAGRRSAGHQLVGVGQTSRERPGGPAEAREWDTLLCVAF
eukprot:535632-Prorocentrum_minimum.AAC.6